MAQKTGAVSAAKLKLIFSMLIFGTIGIFVRYIGLPSSVIAVCRGYVGMLFLILLLAVRRQQPDWQAIRCNLLLLVVSGGLIGMNWIALFEAYNYTTVTTATLCYYLAPVFVTLASPFVLKEKLTGKKLICVAVALFGMVFVSGVLEGGISGLRGILYGVTAAVLYASVILLNKRMKPIPAFDKTLIQLGVAATVALPYVAATVDVGALAPSSTALALLLVVGIVHTGVAYAMYFSSMTDIPAQTVALFSYIDPVSAIFLSAIFLSEPLTLFGCIGAVLVLGSTMVSELSERKK